MNGGRRRRSASRAAFLALAATALGGCQVFEPPATPHPAIVSFVTRPGLGEIALVDPGRLQGLPIAQDEAILRATAGMDPTTAGGPIVAWGAQVATPAGTRFAWIIIRGDPRDPDLTARDSPVELAVIDAVTGLPLQWRPRACGRGVISACWIAVRR